ncbi:signal peptidase II [Sedimentibacter sp. zth1]|uniref:signal peptidase II n=1 Tax=Sedimentibacter sp. zth1 TaxID=2816908 RepID=UPI001A91049A|nr:signal peptidase II [Sedimentibacter sp. zth1]QSX06878.1 signal peptidase II [Sedimentibacter sp. zth1]
MHYIYGVIILASLVIDQITKLWAVKALKDFASISVLGSFLSFKYVENRGAAFGILQDQRIFFIISTVLLIGFIVAVILFNKKITKCSRYALVLILSGAIGNFIDRFRLGYVVDFIDFKFGSFYDFPVFNVADCCVVVGTILLLLLIIFNKFEKSKIDG